MRILLLTFFTILFLSSTLKAAEQPDFEKYALGYSTGYKLQLAEFCGRVTQNGFFKAIEWLESENLVFEEILGGFTCVNFGYRLINQLLEDGDIPNFLFFLMYMKDKNQFHKVKDYLSTAQMRLHLSCPYKWVYIYYDGTQSTRQRAFYDLFRMLDVTDCTLSYTGDFPYDYVRGVLSKGHEERAAGFRKKFPWLADAIDDLKATK